MTFNCGILRGIVLLHEADRQTVSLVLLHFPHWQVGLESSGEGRQRARSLHSSHLDWHSSDWQLVTVTDTVAAGSLTRWLPGQPESGRNDIIVRVKLRVGDSARSPGPSASATVRLSGAALGFCE